MSEAIHLNPLEAILVEDPTPLRIPVKVGQKEYYLEEADGTASARYKAALTTMIKLGREGTPTGIDGDIYEHEYNLLAACLWEVNTKVGEKNFLVGKVNIQKWPGRVTRPWIERLKKISELEPKQTKAALLLQKQNLEEKLLKLEGPSDPKGELKNITDSSS